MIIHQPEIKTKEGQVIVSSHIETRKDFGLPRELWFKFPVEYEKAVSDRTESFFTTMFLLGMHLNEDIEVRGKVSPQLTQNIQRLSDLYYHERKSYFNLIDYSFDKINAADYDHKRQMRLSSFSGGIDSFYCIWSHLFSDKSDFPTNITHGIFIQGFDLLPRNQENYLEFYSQYEMVFKQWGIPLIHCNTNAYTFYQYRVPWAAALMPTLAGTASALGKGTSHYYQPGNHNTDPVNSPNPKAHFYLLSTETLEVSTHAMQIDRPKKIEKMLDWSPIQKNLRICLSMNNKKGVIACQRCEKCLNTNFILNLYDKQEDFPPYNGKFTVRKLIRLCLISAGVNIYTGRSYLPLLKRNKQYGTILILYAFIPINKIKLFVSRQVVPRFPKQWVQFLKNRVYNKKHDD